MAAASQHGKSDPEKHRANVYDAFMEYVEAFQYEYDAIARDPPSDETDKTAWVEINKHKVFLGRYASRSFQKDYEDTVTPTERTNLKFKDLVKKMKTRYEPTRNYTLANYEFHSMKQNTDESFDTYVHRVKQEAKGCQFSCESPTCTIPDTMVRDQVIVGMNDDEIRKNALKNQWNLKDLVDNGRKLEVAVHSAQQIIGEIKEEKVTCVKPGRYLTKSKKKKKHACENCSSKTCKGGKKCPAYHLECFKCGKNGHFRGAKACKALSRKKCSTRRVESESEDSPSSESSLSAESSEAEEESTNSETSSSSSKKAKTPGTRKVTKNYVTKIRRVRRKYPVCKFASKPRYQVKVVIKENIVPVFADTGADISVMSFEEAKKLNLPLKRTRAKIRPYGSKTLKCTGFYDGTVMFRETVANARIYVIKKTLETLLSGRLCEELGIIESN